MKLEAARVLYVCAGDFPKWKVTFILFYHLRFLLIPIVLAAMT